MSEKKVSWRNKDVNYTLTLGQVATINSPYLRPCKATEEKLEGRKVGSKSWIT